MKSTKEYVWKTWPARRIARKDSLYCFLTSIFASYPPQSFKIICFTCIWSKFVDISFHSLQNPQQTPCCISQFSKNGRTHRGLGLAKSICAPNLETTGSNAKFGEYISLSVLKLLYLHDRETIYETQYDL